MGLRKLTGQKTYWHLLDARRRPSTYEIASSRLHWYPELGFSIDTPIRAWYQKYQTGSLFDGVDWEAFVDPRKTTYAGYTQLQTEREAYLTGVLEADRGEHDAALDDEWRQSLTHTFAPLRFPCHALMMMAAYLASMAPGSRVTIAASFQAGDEIRRVHALARRLHQLRTRDALLGDDARERWQQHTAWQPLRRIVEQSLVVYDWSECFIVLNLALKPAFDHLVNQALAAAARHGGDHTTAQLLGSLALDAQWHQAWARDSLAVALAQKPASRDGVLAALKRWAPPIDAALAQLVQPLAPDADAGAGAAVLMQARRQYLASCNLEIAL